MTLDRLHSYLLGLAVGLLIVHVWLGVGCD